MLRLANQDDLPFLKWMLFEASYVDQDNRPSFDMGLSDPTIAVYLEDWPRRGDLGLIVTNQKNAPLGAAWYRLFTVDKPGYGFIDEHTPEIAIALRPDVRGQGLGSKLLESLIQIARKQGHRQISLAVEHTNPRARRLYERLGFVEVDGNEEESKMVLDLRQDPAAD
ncbi:MAG: GNAT family N-acetyltransferase [Actinomycetota bacterium]